MDVINRVLSFWYDEKDPDLSADGEHLVAWFKKDKAFDKAILDQFEADVIAAANGKYNELRETLEGVLTLAILLDQFPRNLYRGSWQAFATDTLALDIVKGAVANGFDFLQDVGPCQQVLAASEGFALEVGADSVG